MQAPAPPPPDQPDPDDCDDDADTDVRFRSRLFAELRRRWIAAEDGRRSVDLARQLEVPRQSITMWATGGGRRRRAVPPWPVIQELLDTLGLEVRLCGTAGAVLTARAGGQGLQVYPDDLVLPFHKIDFAPQMSL